MRLFSSLGLGLLGLVATAVLAQDDPAVVELDKGSFKKFIQNNHVVLTECECHPHVPFCVLSALKLIINDPPPTQSTL